MPLSRHSIASSTDVCRRFSRSCWNLVMSLMVMRNLLASYVQFCSRITNH